MRRIPLFAALCALLLIQATRAAAPHTITITGAAATVQIDTSVDVARSFLVFAPSGNSSTVRVGPSTTSSTVGQPIAAGAAVSFDPIPNASYSLNQFYVYVANGDTAIITWIDP